MSAKKIVCSEFCCMLMIKCRKQRCMTFENPAQLSGNSTISCWFRCVLWQFFSSTKTTVHATILLFCMCVSTYLTFFQYLNHQQALWGGGLGQRLNGKHLRSTYLHTYIHVYMKLLASKRWENNKIRFSINKLFQTVDIICLRNTFSHRHTHTEHTCGCVVGVLLLLVVLVV